MMEVGTPEELLRRAADLAILCERALRFNRPFLRQHGGGVRVQSRPAEGATFYLDLPLENGSLP